MAKFILKNEETQQESEIWAKDWEDACDKARYETNRLMTMHTIRTDRSTRIGVKCTHENTVLYRGEVTQEICLDCGKIICEG